MKNSGFTLVELFAVIIVMGILATLGTVVVMDVIEESKMNSAISSAEQVVKAITIAYTTNDNFTTDKLDILSFNFKGKKPDAGYIQFNENEKVRFYMVYNEYCIIKDFDSELEAIKLNDGDICDWDTIDSIIE